MEDDKAMVEYKVVETSEVTAEGLEALANEWTGRGWRLDGIQFVVKESARRPSMAFIFFVRSRPERRGQNQKAKGKS
jgi:hypothetical protein